MAYPTEAVYGLGCDPFNPAAAARLIALKGRDAGKGFILIGASLAQFAELIVALEPAVIRRILAPRPGPVSWLLPARRGVPPWLTGDSGLLAVRVTGHPGAAALCRAFGAPLVSTSANRSGRRPARSGLEVRARFRGGLDYVLPGRCGGAKRESQIRDARSNRIVRE